MKRFTDAGRKAVADKNYYAALSLALMMPDICASIEDPGPGKSQKRYEAWFAKWAQPKFNGGPNGDHVFMSAADCFQLRCSLIHSGTAEILPARQDVLERFEFFDDSGTLHLGWIEGHVVNGVAQPNVLILLASLFSQSMFEAADEWDAAVAGDQEIQRIKKSLLSIRSRGHKMGAFSFG